MNKSNKKHTFILTGAHLKWIALSTMLIDHIGAVLLETGPLPLTADAVLAGNSFRYLPADYTFWYTINFILRLIGRIAFPLYCFLLVEGFFHTKSLLKYTLRLGMFALISEVPYDLARSGSPIDFEMQNVYFTLLIGLLVLWAMKELDASLPVHMAPVKYLAALTGMMIAEFLQTDYSAFGVLLIVLLFLFHNNRKQQCILGAVSTLWEYTAPLAFLLTWHYNGERGKQLPKYFFYTFYPLHLLLLSVLRTFIF